MAGRARPDDDWHERPMRSRARASTPRTATTARRRPTSPPTRTGGTRSRSTAATRASRSTSGAHEDGKLRLDARRTAAARPRERRRPHRRGRELLARPRPAAHAVHARAQRDLRPAAEGVPDLVRRQALRHGAARERGRDGEDPHGRVDARADLAPDHRVRDAGQLVGLDGILGKHLGRLTKNEVLSGIPGSATNHHGVPYSITEEFVAVYRMHPLLPDDFTFRSLADDRRAAGADVPRDRCHADARPARGDRAGRLVLLVRPRQPGRDHAAQLPALPADAASAPTARPLDLAALDVLRIRERGVPRYNEFRRLST